MTAGVKELAKDVAQSAVNELWRSGLLEKDEMDWALEIIEEQVNKKLASDEGKEVA